MLLHVIWQRQRTADGSCPAPGGCKCSAAHRSIRDHERVPPAAPLVGGSLCKALSCSSQLRHAVMTLHQWLRFL